MALEEGFRRLRIVGRAILLAGLALEAVTLVAAVVAMVFARGEFVSGFGFLGALGVPFCLLGAGVLLAVWIAEGFAHPRRPPHS
jgi:Na+/H+ antiporter NhaC